MKSLKKYISVFAAIAVMGAFSVSAYAQMVIDDTDEESSESIEVIEDIDTTDEPEEEEDAEGEDPGNALGDLPTDVDVIDTDAADLEEPEDTEAPDPIATNPVSTTADQTTAPAPATTTAAGAITYTRTDPYTMYASENVNIRQGPGTNYSVIGSVTATKEVKVLGTNGSWIAIDYYGGVGFVSGSYLTSTAPTTTAGTTAAQTTAAQPVETTSQTEAEITQPPIETTDQGEAAIPEETSDNTPDVVIDDDDNNEPAVTTTEEKKPAETTTEETTAAAAAASTKNDNGGSGLTGILIALACAVGTFLLIGVVPVVIHSIYHKKMYEY